MSLEKQKHEYLLGKGLEFEAGVNKFVFNCELCNNPLKCSLHISKKGLAWGITAGIGEFHHDAKGKLHLYCRDCHIKLHDWGVLQRWLKRINKKPEELPDCIELKAVIKYSGWS